MRLMSAPATVEPHTESPPRSAPEVSATAAEPAPSRGILEGKRILITGVATTSSIAWNLAHQAQTEGAQIILTSFGRMRRLTERAAAQLPTPPEIIDLDVTQSSQITNVAQLVKHRWGGLDGVLHAVAYADPLAMSGNFLSTPPASALQSLEVSAISLKELVSALAPLLARDDSGSSSVVALSFDTSAAWPSYDWMGVSKAALEAITRYLARDLGPRRIRVNTVSCAPIRTLAAGQIPAFDQISSAYKERAPIGWDDCDASPVAAAIVFLLSDLARAITGQLLRVDGGANTVGCPTDPSATTT